MKWFKRIAKVIVWVIGITFFLLVLTWIFHSPIVKWAVKKYSP